MEIVAVALVSIIVLISTACRIIILIDAFKQSVGEGFLCLCIDCYCLYYAFSKFEHPRKGLILAGWIGAPLLAACLFYAIAGLTGGLNRSPGY